MPKPEKGKISVQLPEDLAELLLKWYDRAKRDLPWRDAPGSYGVWVSEIMLQQTRVETVKDYYVRFLAELPAVEDLAMADEEKLMKLWQGLGYYSRVRNMAAAAKKIMSEHNGNFPRNWQEIRDLPGIGDYTAGAIASIAFGLPEPAVDGNVVRVLARLTGQGNDDGIWRTAFAEALRSRYPAGRCGDFTQSLMELGATVCLPNGAPHCGECPLNCKCRALSENRIGELPGKKVKTPRKICEMTVFVILNRARDQILLKKRGTTGLLAGLWELPHTARHEKDVAAVRTAAAAAAGVSDCGILSLDPLPVKTHIFTHIEWRMRPYLVVCDAAELRGGVPLDQLSAAYPLPVAFSKVLPDGLL